jgi:hypothetical protein
MKAKTFDCVEMKHRGAERVREQTKGMTLEQELAFWQERSRLLRRRQTTAKGGNQVPTNEEQQAP